MKQVVICRHCGKAFSTKQNARKYCSKRCILLERKKGRTKSIKAFCRYCGKNFESNRKKNFCDDSCRKSYMSSFGIIHKKVTKVPVTVTIEDVAKKCKTSGLSYGRYVQLRKL